MVNSTLYDSDDENQINVSKDFYSNPGKFAKKIQTLGQIEDYPVTAILTELSSRILLDDPTDKAYRKLKDPLQFQIDRFQRKIDYLEADKGLTVNSVELLNASSLNPDSNPKVDKNQLIAQSNQKILDLEKKINVYRGKLSDLQSLQLKRDNLVAGDLDKNVPPVKGAFPFIPKKLSETFCDNCREKLSDIFENFNNIQIQGYFLDFRNHLQAPNLNLKEDKKAEYDQVFSEIFGKQPQRIGAKNTNKQYIAPLVAVVTSKLGKYDENDLHEYLRLNQINRSRSNEVKKMLNEYIKNNLSTIYELTEQTAHYSLDSKYLEAVAGINNILAQTRLYYKIHRDINKNTLVLGGDGQRNYPPGLNTTAKIFSSGANSLFLGELGSYKDITEDNLHTLKNYGMKNTNSVEKSAEFRSLMQIEALRSPASILANNMFFYLSRPNKEFMNTVGIKYERNKIDKLMPMAMKGAVGGVTYIENEVGESLSSRIKYDYRHVDNKERASAKLLEIKNHQIMFDFICAKSGIVDRHNGKVLVQKSGGWTFTDLQTSIITAIKDDYEFELQKINNEYKIIKIKTFPAKIIQELLEKEYGMQLPNYMKDGKFKVEVNAIASKELRDLNTTILALEKNKKLGPITFKDQEITKIRKDFNELNLSLYEITSTEKSKKLNVQDYNGFTEKLNKLKSDLSPENTLKDLKEKISSICQDVTQKQILDRINNLEQQLSKIATKKKLQEYITKLEKLEKEVKKPISMRKKKPKQETSEEGSKYILSPKKPNPNNTQQEKKPTPITVDKNTSGKNLKKEQEGSKYILSPKKPNPNNTQQEKKPVPISIGEKRLSPDKSRKDKSSNKKQKTIEDTIKEAEVIRQRVGNKFIPSEPPYSVNPPRKPFRGRGF